MRQVGLSFDDSFVNQRAWARTMHNLGLRGTFYISPGRIDTVGYLQTSHLEEMATWGHLIGNHTWEHEAPKSVGERAAVEAAWRARAWLDERSFSGSLLALPWGSRGGGWSEAVQAELALAGFALRDVRFDSEPLAQGALESVAPPLDATEPDLRYFHGPHVTSDDLMAKFLYSLAAERDAGNLTLLLPEGH
jgi:peptidoglycan/xylan/chitin deacetylase (PgdA/CDA1 family)